MTDIQPPLPYPTGPAPAAFAPVPAPGPTLGFGPVSFTPPLPSAPLVPQLPMVGGIVAPFIGQAQTRPSIDPNLQKNLRSMQRKWQDIAPIIQPMGNSTSGAPILNTLLDLDRQRVARGQLPMTKQQTAKAAQALLTGELSTGKPKRNPLALHSNAISDLASIVKAIPRIPSAIVSEVLEAPKGFAEVSAALGRGDIAAALEAPGVRMLPGAYVAANLARGDVAELARHPLFTALDVLPAAKQLAPAAKGALAGTKVAKAAEVVGDAAKGTKAVQLWQEAFGRDSREFVAREINPINMSLETMLNPDTYMPYMKWGDSLDDGTPMGARAAADRNAFITEMQQYGRDSASWIRDVDEATRVSATRKATLGDFESMSPEELAFSRKADDVARAVAATVERYTGEIRGIDIPRPDGSPGIEWYDAGTADRIIKARDTATRARTYSDLRAAVASPGADPTPHLERARAILDTPTASRVFRDARGVPQGRTVGALSAAAKRQQVDLALTAADMAGVDTRAARRALHTRGEGAFDAARAALDDAASIPAVPLVSVDDMIATVRRYGRQWTKAGELTQALRSGEFPAARRLARDIMGNKRATIPELATFLDSLDRYAARDRVLARTSRFTDRLSARLETRSSELTARSAPARFREVLVDRSVSTLADRIEAGEIGAIPRAMDATPGTPGATGGATGAVSVAPSDATRNAIVQAIMERRYGDLGFADEAAFDSAWYGIRDDISRTWQQMRDELGVEPVFLHRVSAAGFKQVRFPRIGEIAIKPSAARAATVDISPHIPDLAIGLTHEALEYLAREGSEHFARSVTDAVGVTLADLQTRYAPDARRAAELNPSIDYSSHLEALIKRRYTAFDPEALGFKWSSQRFDQIKAEGIFIPKYIASGIQRYHAPGPTRLSAAWDPVMKVYRTALLPLSPRWHTNNIVGGGILATVRTSPLIIRDALAAWGQMRAGTLPEWVQRQLDLTGGQEAKFLAEVSHASGRTQGRLMQEMVNTPGNKFVAAASKRMGRVVEGSYALNQFVDNMYRAASLMYGERKAIGKGVDVDTARMAGVELMHKIMPEWSAMTALERSIMRQVFPFYAFVGHMMRTVRTFPADHPVRASIMGAITRAELEDLGTGLPEDMLGVFRFGDVDENGNQKAFSVGAMNPFADVPSFFGALGWASAMNPMLSTFAEQLGFADGQREAYPTLTYDAASGRLVAKQPGLAASFLTNTIPQVELLSIFTGSSEDFRKSLRENPDAAMRRLYSLTGIPLTNFRSVNFGQEIARNELNVQEAQTLERNRALKSGDWSEAERFPELQQYFAKLQQLPPEALGPMMQDPAALNQATADLLASLNGTAVGTPGTPGTSGGVSPQQRNQAQVVRRAHAGGI